MTDITISFGANISGLNDALSQASANTKSFSGSLADAASSPNASFAALKESLDTLNATLGQNTATALENKTSWLDVALGVTAAELALSTLGTALRGVTALAAEPFTQLAKIPAELERFPEDLKAAAQALLAFGGTLVAAGEWLFSFDEGFNRGVIVVQQFIRSIEIYRSGLLATEGAAIAAAGNMGKLQEAAAQMGFENATRLLQSFTTQLTLIPGMSNEAAAGIVSTLGSITNFSGQATRAVIDILPKLTSSADAAKTLASNIANAFADPASNGKEFLKTLGGVSAQLQEQFTAAVQSGNVNKQQGVLYDARYVSSAQNRPVKSKNNGQNSESLQTSAICSGAPSDARPLRRQNSTMNSINPSVRCNAKPMRSAICRSQALRSSPPHNRSFRTLGHRSIKSRN